MRGKKNVKPKEQNVCHIHAVPVLTPVAVAFLFEGLSAPDCGTAVDDHGISGPQLNKQFC